MTTVVITEFFYRAFNSLYLRLPPETLRMEIDDLLDNKERRDFLGENARKRVVRDFDIRNCSIELNELMVEVV